jgi:hypothetical protein
MYDSKSIYVAEISKQDDQDLIAELIPTVRAIRNSLTPILKLPDVVKIIEKYAVRNIKKEYYADKTIAELYSAQHSFRQRDYGYFPAVTRRQIILSYLEKGHISQQELERDYIGFSVEPIMKISGSMGHYANYLLARRESARLRLTRRQLMIDEMGTHIGDLRAPAIEAYIDISTGESECEHESESESECESESESES